MKRTQLIVITFVLASAAQAKDSPVDRDLLEWAHNAPQVPAGTAKAPQPTSPQPLFVDRVPDLPKPALKSSKPGGITDVARFAGRAVGAAGSTVGKACTSFARAYECNDYVKPDYMRANERTARYNNKYSVETNRDDHQLYSDLQMGTKPLHSVEH